MRDFKKYDIWQLSHSFTLEIYKITSTFPKEELYGLTSQIRRASSSFQLILVKDVEEIATKSSINFST